MKNSGTGWKPIKLNKSPPFSKISNPTALDRQGSDFEKSA